MNPHRLLIVMISIMAMFVQAGCSGKNNQVELIACADIVKGCSSEQLKIRFDAVPQTMKPFNVLVEMPGAESMEASFVMDGMEMGLNRYRLIKKTGGFWQAEVILPVCMQGRGDWLMELKVETPAGRWHYQLGFATSQTAP